MPNLNLRAHVYQPQTYLMSTLDPTSNFHQLKDPPTYPAHLPKPGFCQQLYEPGLKYELVTGTSDESDESLYLPPCPTSLKLFQQKSKRALFPRRPVAPTRKPNQPSKPDLKNQPLHLTILKGFREHTKVPLPRGSLGRRLPTRPKQNRIDLA